MKIGGAGSAHLDQHTPCDCVLWSLEGALERIPFRGDLISTALLQMRPHHLVVEGNVLCNLVGQNLIPVDVEPFSMLAANVQNQRSWFILAFNG